MSPFTCNHDGSCEEIRQCCFETEMTLTREDVMRIGELGYKPKDYLVRSEDGFCELKLIDGFCLFYDRTTKLCTIYDHRPAGCKYYPITYHWTKRKCVLDHDCPSKDTTTKQEIRKVCHRVRRLVETLVQEARHGDSPC